MPNETSATEELSKLESVAATRKRDAELGGRPTKAQKWRDVESLARRKRLLADLNDDLPGPGDYLKLALVILGVATAALFLFGA